MERQLAPSQYLKCIAGAALVGLGLFVLFGNLGGTAAQLGCPLGTTAADLGVLPSIVLAASQALQTYAFDRQRFLQSLLQTLVSFWPLLLVIPGAVLLQDAFTDKVRAMSAPNKYSQE
jgi:hypothetical protein